MSSRSSSFADDYEALTSGQGFFALSDWSSIAIYGADRISFLHNMCTNDIQRLTPGQGCEAFCTDVKGKIVAHVWVLALDDHLMLLTVPSRAETILGHLDRYLIREDVQLADQTEQKSWLMVPGTTAQH